MINESIAISSVATPELKGVSPQLMLKQPEGANFVDWVASEMKVVNGQINTAEFNVRELAAGRADNLHHVMTSLSKAKLSFQLAVEVRNKLLEGYHDIIKMQI
jgi:flagellar hook-basal body complex protein FliE